MMTRTHVQNLFKEKNNKKYVDLIEGSEEIIPIQSRDETIKFQRDSAYSNTSRNKTVSKSAGKSEIIDLSLDSNTSEIDTTGLKKKRKRDRKIKNDSKAGFYEAEEIIGKKFRHGNIYYKIKWKNYPEDQATWELKSNFTQNAGALIRDYEKKKREIRKREMEDNSKIPKQRRLRKLKLLSKNIKETTENNNFRVSNLNEDSLINNLCRKDKTTSSINSEEKRFSKRLLRQANKKGRRRINYIEEINLESSDDSNSESDDSKKTSEYEYGENASYFSARLSSSNSFSDVSPYTISTKKSRKNSITEKKLNTPNKIKNKISSSKSNGNTKVNKTINCSYSESTVGDIRYDKVKRIISAKIVNPKEVELSCLLEFEQRADGFIPENKRYSSKLVRYYAPQSLIDFYQSRICINKPI